MGHSISAIICKPSVDIARLEEFNLPALQSGDFIIIPMDPNHFDEWTERLGLSFGEGNSKLIIEGPFSHHIASVAADGDYAIIETDYFGGKGDQVAAVFQKGNPLPIFSSERVASGAINTALKLIGVDALRSLDEFDTLGLGKYRDFEDYFELYYD